MANIILHPKEEGNTKTVCDALARESDWESVYVNGREFFDLSQYDHVVLGSGVYGGLPHKNLRLFIRGLKEEQLPKKVYVLLTWLGRGHSDGAAFNHIKRECSLRGIEVAPEYKSSLGFSFGLLHRGRPSKEDLQSCVDWVKGL